MDELILREPEVRRITGLSRSTRWRLMRRGEFPRPIQISLRAVGWRAAEIVEWSKNRAEATNGPVKKNFDVQAGRGQGETASASTSMDES